MENPNPSKDFFLPQLEDKLEFLKECIQQVEEHLQKRQRQKQEFISELEQKLCEVQTSIYYLDQMGDVRCNQMSKRRIALEREIKKLEKEKRVQELEYWRDITDLQKELRQLRREYRAVKVGLCSSQMR